jgi:thioredoxin-related protein
MLQRIVLIALILVTGVTSAQKINWMSMNDALAAQEKEPRLIFVDMYTKWCGPCKMMDRDTFSNADVADYINENYYAVKFNAEGDEQVRFNDKDFSNPNYDPAKATRRNSVHQFTRHVGVRAYPTVVFISKESEVLTTVKSYRKPQQLELYLKLFAEGDYKAVKTQEDFNKYTLSFKPTFKVK